MENINDLLRLFVCRKIRLRELEDLNAPKVILDNERELIADATYKLNELGFNVGEFIESEEYDKAIERATVINDDINRMSERCRSCIHIQTSYDEGIGVKCGKDMFEEGCYPDKCDEYKSCGMDWQDREHRIITQCLGCKFQGNGEEFGDVDCLIKKDEFALPCKFKVKNR